MLRQLIAIRDMVLHAFLLHFCKAYNTLDWERCLDIMTGYGDGPRTICVLWTYWDRPQMVTKAGGHYGPTFQSHRWGSSGGPPVTRDI